MAIKTRVLILSDTHGEQFSMPSVPVDVAIHCGDLTEESKLSEFREAIELLRSIDAPLKLVIAGNHDFTLDEQAFKSQITEANRLRTGAGQDPLTTQEIHQTYGKCGEARDLLEKEATCGIRFLDEGSYDFELQNGATLSVYASPYTQGSASGWGFQYDPAQGHKFDIPESTDIVITHGPPLGVFDMTESRKRAGCPELFAAIARSRPRIHCFGHIHEGWGAKLAAWRDPVSAEPSHFTDIDNSKSTTVETLPRLRPGKYDSADDVAEKEHRKQSYQQNLYCPSNHCSGREAAVMENRKTLFVNASIQGRDDIQEQWPWLIDVDFETVQRLA